MKICMSKQQYRDKLRNAFQKGDAFANTPSMRNSLQTLLDSETQAPVFVTNIITTVKGLIYVLPEKELSASSRKTSGSYDHAEFLDEFNFQDKD